MKITRHTAKDMRQALKLVRDQLGPDAVILTSKRTPFGVEVTAAVDFDASRVEAQAQVAAPVPMPASAEPRPFQPEEFAPPATPGARPGRPARPEVDPYTVADVHQQAEEEIQQSVFARLQAEMQQPAGARPAGAERQLRAVEGRRNGDVMAVVPAAPARAVKSAAISTSIPALTSVQASVPSEEDVHSALENAIDSFMAEDDASTSAAPSPAIQQAPSLGDPEHDMGAELRAMRRILETQMAQLAWNDLTRRAPIHTEILRELTEVGLSQDFASQIVAQLPAGTDLTKARRLSIALISQRINVTGDRWLDKGGRIALIGPTGVGKTTALAKLAVRWVLRHGARSLALISADGVRIGAHDQMQALGQMLDAPVYIAENFAQIPKYLEQLGTARLVLVDTPGMSQRDAQLATRMKQLADGCLGLETALVLSASTQAGAIAETVARFAPAKATSALLTKVDEAASLGGILSVLANAELPISYVSEGQRVPEDLRPARALELVSSAVHLAKSSGAAADEDLLRRRYGEVAHALA